jgi:hypothetical protein
MLGRDGSIEASWDVTSDSLALLLATRLGAARLLLVKSGEATAPDLLDRAFIRLRPAFSGELRILHRSAALPAGPAAPM